MNTNVVIIDYGIGNVSSVLRAVKKFTPNCELTDNPEKIVDAERLILPGDGAFGDTMNQLNKKHLITPLLRYISDKKPFLGICVGMQVLATISEEFGIHKGLNLIPGKVIKFKKSKSIHNPYKIPQIGWNKLVKPKHVKTWKGTILEGISEGNWVYFIHSYIVIPNNKSYNLALTKYGDTIYSSIIMKENIVACQFHPEKSATIGLRIVENFISNYEKKRD